MEIPYTATLRSESNDKRMKNILAFSALDRHGLAYGVVERRVLMKEYDSGEKLYIQYPGKETLPRGNRLPRPWDFRPKLLLANGVWLDDLSFKDVWDGLYQLKDFRCDMCRVATLFFRMAYMLDADLTIRTLTYEDIDANNEIVNRGKITLNWYEYMPSETLLEGLSLDGVALGGCSLLPYLAYNDYLAQNEDCKYYYREVHERGNRWSFASGTGRTNTLLTHMSVIAFMEGFLKFTEITDMFQRGMGVAPLPKKMWEKVTNGSVKA